MIPLFNTRDNEEFKGIKSDYSSPLISKLRQALSEELIAWYQYYSQRDILVGQERAMIEETFKDFEKDELYDHSEKLKNRLIQLGDDLSFLQQFQWNAFTQNRFKPLTSPSVLDALRLNIAAEEAAIKTYNDLIDIARQQDDEVTKKMAKEILQDEEDHLQSLKDFLNDVLYAE